EAAKSGLQTATYNEFDLPRLIRETGSYFEARARMLAAIFERRAITGTVSFYGLGDPGQSFVMLNRLSELCPDLTVTGEAETTIFDEAYATKDADELAAIRSVAERTNAVAAETAAFLKGHPTQDEQLVKEDGNPLTVGDVKRFVRLRLLEHDLEEAEGMIFAIGRDAGVPHSRGEGSDILRLGQSIIFDLFPRELGGGYFHDMTRTFCLGYAPLEVQEAYDQVMHVFRAVMEKLKVGEKAATYQELACKLFEEWGHQTPRSHPGTENGYVHSLGHGLGLEIHARPRLSAISQDTIQPGQVFTVEPGLYYPGRGFGVRIEDTVYVGENGDIHSLTPFPKDLVLPVQE
ncbi:MAG TPA: aminopeptidase P family protein, partial [Chloroflexi bacterium]|nr:aminopeptidase P family protein [Chloroflexota bacterium]